VDQAERAGADTEAHEAAFMKNMRRKRACFRRSLSQTCSDCGETIPAERRAAMAANGMPCERCVACQTRFEKGF